MMSEVCRSLQHYTRQPLSSLHRRLDEAGMQGMYREGQMHSDNLPTSSAYSHLAVQGLRNSCMQQ